jgi:hypothetical protein
LPEAVDKVFGTRTTGCAVFPAEFYYGNMLGSFNSYARWLTGILFGVTTVFAIFPILKNAMLDTRQDLEYQLARIYQAEAN